MRKTLATLVFAATFAFLKVPHAEAQSRTLVTLSNPAPSSISGEETGNTTDHLEAPENFFLYSVEFGENGDIPCYIKATYYSMGIRPAVTLARQSSGRDQSEPELVRDTETVSQEFSRCDGRVGDNETVTLPNWGGNNPFTVVGGIRVCQRRNNNRLKGITLFASSVNASNVTFSPSNSISEDRGRCNQQQARVTCSSNRVATGLLISHERAGRSSPTGRRNITGLGLLCSRATVQVER